jgi:hypothetical protein
MLLKELDEKSYAIRTNAYPTFYNLLVDPKEEVPDLNYLSDTWAARSVRSPSRAR